MPALLWKQLKPVPEPPSPDLELMPVEQTPGIIQLAEAAREKLGYDQLSTQVRIPEWERETRNRDKEESYRQEKIRAGFTNELAFHFEQLGIEVLDEQSLAVREQAFIKRFRPEFGTGFKEAIKELLHSFFGPFSPDYTWNERKIGERREEVPPHLLERAVQIAQRIPKAEFAVKSFHAHKVGVVDIPFPHEEYVYQKKLMGNFLVVKLRAEKKVWYEKELTVEYVIGEWAGPGGYLTFSF